MNSKAVSILDSTLRDGAQGIGISFSIDDRLQILALLDNLGIAYIEAGNPASNPKELEFFKRAEALELKNSKLCAFGSTRRKGIKAEEDASLSALIEANTPVCTIFGKSSRFHVEQVLETTAAENLAMIKESCEFIKSSGKELIYDAEHFFDGFKDDSAYAIETLKAAADGGADIICLCDTNGGAFPDEVSEILARVKCEINLPVGVHFHNDGGVAVANSIEAALAGAAHIQGTFIGFGERCGNANLSAIIPNLQLKLGVSCVPDKKLRLFRQTAEELAAVSNIDLDPSMPYVGKYAFAHKAGMHANGVLKASESFEHIQPRLVGNARWFPASEISGKAVILEKIKTIFPDISISAKEADEILAHVKAQEQSGYQFEGADASFELLVRRKMKPFLSFFELIHYNIHTVYAGGFTLSGATVKLKVNGAEELMAAEGNGPVNALDTAIRKGLEVFYPVLSTVKLIDYKVRVLDATDATASRVRVLITSSDGQNTFTTVGVSEDVVAASWKAIEDSIIYLLLRDKYDSKSEETL